MEHSNSFERCAVFDIEKGEIIGATKEEKDLQDQSELRKSFMLQYLNKFKGVQDKQAPEIILTRYSVIWSSTLSFAGILVVSMIDEYYLFPTYSFRMLSGSLGAVSVLIFDAVAAPLAQPYNVWLGFILSSFIGVTIAQVGNAIGIPVSIQAAMAVSIAIAGMKSLKCTFPPGGACALIATIGGEKVTSLGYGYVLSSFGAIFVLFTVSIFGNNAVPWIQYPQYWY